MTNNSEETEILFIYPEIWLLPDAEPPSSQNPTAIKRSETCLLKG